MHDPTRIIPSTFYFYLVLVFAACSRGTTDQSVEFEGVAISNLSGRALAEAHCSRCHLYVAPEILPKSVWKKDVLPAMGHRMGIYSHPATRDSVYAASNSEAIIRQINLYPETPVIAIEDWKKLVAYYLEQAPDTVLPYVREQPIRIGLKHFKYREPSVNNRPPLTSMVKILDKQQGIVFGDAKGPRNTLTFLHPSLQENFKLYTQVTPVQLHQKDQEMYLTASGRGVFPTDHAQGALLRISKNEGTYRVSGVIAPNLQRPVHTSFGDLDGDGREDMVVCEFGNETGKLAWYHNNGRGGYDQRLIHQKPGAITSIIKDANGDGLPDIYVLMAQGDEGVFLYENQGGGQFLEKRLLTFSPLHGSQYIELADFNGDGYDDLVCVAGDNADKTPILKKYHGIYIYLNNGKGAFEQAFFYPLNGAYKAIARDFDQDGDLDIAAISFFPDYIRYPEESFVYLENKGNLKFNDFTFSQASKGRWMVMDSGDLDGDGDIDLVLGSFVYFLPAGDTTGLGKKWLETSPSMVLLENTIR